MEQHKTVSMNICKLEKYLPQQSSEELFSQRHELKVLPKSHTKIYVELDKVDDTETIEPTITAFDIAVMDAIYTIYYFGDFCFTPGDVIRCMSGQSNLDITDQKIAKVRNSIHKLSKIMISIDCTDEFRIRKKDKNIVSQVFQSTLLSVKERTVLSNNHLYEVDGYELLEMPVLYQYATEVGQVVSVRSELLSPNCGRINETETAMLLRHTLIKRIEGMKNKKNKLKSRQIRYERFDPNTRQIAGLFPSIGIQSKNYKNWRKKKAALHKTVVSILQSFVKCGYIKAFKVTHNGTQEISGVDISL